MTEQNSITTRRSFSLNKSPLDEDASQYSVQFLPAGSDIAKALIIVMVVATVAPTVTRFSYRWLQDVQEAAESGHSVAVSDDIDSTAVGQPDHLPEKHADTPDHPLAKHPLVNHQPPRPNPTGTVEGVEATANSTPSHSQGRNVSSHESPQNRQAAKQAVAPRPPKEKEPPRIVFFDNAGRSYLTKAERDAAEVHRLAESLRRYPAMKPQQRAIMRQRAFARLEMLDAQQ